MNQVTYSEMISAWEGLVDEHPHLFLSPLEVWFRKLEELRQYIYMNDALPSRDIPIGIWTHTQKMNYKKSKDAMNEDPPRYAWEDLMSDHPHLFLTNEEKWIEKLNELKSFINEHGTLPTKQTHATLNAWVVAQKKNYKNVNKSMKKPSIRAQWEEFVGANTYLFLSEKKRMQLWFERLEELKQHIEENGELPRPSENKDLSDWVQYQKKTLLSEK